jgi:hypothetical protein
MAATVISRATWTDDDGSGTTGTIIGNARLQADVYDKVDALFSGASTFEFGGAVTIDGILNATGAQLLTPVITRPLLTGYSETIVVPTIVAGTLTINLALGNHFAFSLNANITTLTISNVPLVGVIGFSFRFAADGTARTIAWPASFRPAYGTFPTPTSTVNAQDIYDIYTDNAGAIWWLTVRGQAF